MSSHLASTSRPRSTNKTLYTPVFYPTSRSSSSELSIAQTDIPEEYLDHLSRKHIALAQIVQEAPSSRCGSPFEGEETSRSTAKVDALRQRVREAFKCAGGDPADGKWSLVSQLLRLNTARRMRWLGPTTEGERVQSGSGWINAQSEREWNEWEEKWKQELRLKQKIEIWQQNLDKGLVVQSESLASTSQVRHVPEHTKGKEPSAKHQLIQGQLSQHPKSALSRDLRDPSALGFRAVKRSSSAVIKKAQHSGKIRDSVGGQSNTPLESIVCVSAANANPPIAGCSGMKPQQYTIQDVSEASFFPPSFPDQLDVSTPNAKHNQRRKPAPIAHANEPLTNTARLHNHGKTDQYPPPHPTPYDSLQSESSPVRNVEKRPRSITPQHVMKKARLETSVIVPDASLLPNTPAPIEEHAIASTPIITTPKRMQLPKLTDLLASSRKGKTSPERKLGSLVLHEKSHSSKPLPHQPQTKVPQACGETTSGLELEPQQIYSKTSLTEAQNNPVSISNFDEPIGIIHDKLGGTSLLDLAPDYGRASPTKSLSSLAASDSEDEEDFGNAEFEPPFTSTQAQGATLGKTATTSGFGGWMGYNSQFDIDGKVDMVSRFIEKDIDYDGWLKDPGEGSDGVADQ